MKWPAYPKYKDSGVDWLGKVPKGWDIVPFKIAALICNGQDYKAIEDENGEYPVIGSGGEFTRASVYLYNGESVLLGRKGTIDKPLYVNGAFWTIDTMFYTEILKPNVPKFIYYLATTIPFDYYSTNTALPSMTSENLSAHTIAMPSVEEQKAISCFLDAMVSKIDILIADQEKLITLLREKRQVVISHTVTKGLNPAATMKDSGVEWLGSVPMEWKITKIKYIKANCANAFVDGPFGSNLKSMHFIENGDVYVIESNFATQNKIDFENLKTISFDHFESISRSETCENDIIVAKIGAQFGKCSILPYIDKRAVVSGNSLKLTVNNDICISKWAHLQLTNMKLNGEIDLLANGSAQPALSLEGLNNLLFLLPPMPVQEAIINYLDVALNRFDLLINESREMIILLQERRTALISAAVTGKIDVRGLTTSEPA